MNVPKETIFKRITTKIKYYMKTKKLLASMKIEDFKNVSKVILTEKLKFHTELLNIRKSTWYYKQTREDTIFKKQQRNTMHTNRPVAKISGMLLKEILTIALMLCKTKEKHKKKTYT